MKAMPTGSAAPFTRRTFVKTAGAAALLARKGWARPAASNRITVGVIGWGFMLRSIMYSFL
jgi:hypothetical protein